MSGRCTLLFSRGCLHAEAPGSNFAPDRLGRMTLGGGDLTRERGAGLFPDFGSHPAIVLAAMNTSLPALLRISKVWFGFGGVTLRLLLASDLGGSLLALQSRPIFYSLPRRRCYARYGVDRLRRADIMGCTPASTSLPCSVEAQPCPSHTIDIPLPASLRCSAEALLGRPERLMVAAA